MKKRETKRYRYMNRFTKYVWIALVVLAAGCSEDKGENDGPVPGGVPGAESPVPEDMVSGTLDLFSDGRLTVAAGSGAETRAAGPDETSVGDMWMLQFDTEDSAEGTLIHRAYIPAQDIEQSGSTLTAPVMLRQSANCVIVVVANAPESFTVSTLPDGTKLTELRARTFAVSATTGASLPSDASVRLPMFGETEQMAVSLVGSQSVSVKLTRLASRMSLTLINSFTSGYPLLELTSVTLRNAPTKIAYGPLTETTTYLGDVFPEASADNFCDYTPITTGLGSPETNYMWYVAPNRRGKGTATDPEHKDAITAPDGQGSYCTHISIAGKLTRASGAAATNVTYNVYLGANNTDDYNLWANAAYSARLVITGFNEDMLEVGYEGFGITVAPMDGMADNTITGWHPDSGLEYIPSFLTFAPTRIDFGAEEAPEAQQVAFSVNSKWRFSYTSGDAAKVIASSSVAANTDQTGGAQGEPAECEVTFTPVTYRAQSSTPAAGTQYNVVATFATVGGGITDTRTTLLQRTVPTFYGEPAVSPLTDTIPRAGETITATMISNARWSFAVSPGGTITQEPDSYASRSLKVPVPINNTWKSRTVKAVVQYGESMKEWSYIQPGMAIGGVSISPDPADGIPGLGATYTVYITGDCGKVSVRAICGGEVLVLSYGSSDEPATVKVPVNGSSADRTVVFQYQENGVWKNFSRGTQVPGYAVTGATVSPSGDIPGGGGRYTVTLVTLNDLVPLDGVAIRAAVNGSAIAEGTVKTSKRGVVLTVPLNESYYSRTVAFEYKWDGAWVKIGDSRSQAGYSVTSATTSAPASIPCGGGTYSVRLSGTLPSAGVDVRARISGGESVTGKVAASDRAISLKIPINESYNSRTVVFEYLWNGTWTKIGDNHSQAGYSLSKATTNAPASIPGGGGTYTVTLSGALPSAGVEVRANISGGEPVTGTVTASDRAVLLKIPANESYNSRTVVFEYKWKNVWTRIGDNHSQAGYSVSSATTNAPATISGGGGRYTVTLGGFFPAEGVEVRADISGENPATGTVFSSNKTVSLDIPANNGESERTVVFKYKWNGQWVTIKSCNQLFNSRVGSASVSPTGTMPYGGGIYTVKLTGVVIPESTIKVRALGSSELSSEDASVSNKTALAKLVIPANAGAQERKVRFQYWLNGWVDIEQRNQLPTPQVTRKMVSPSGNIGHEGGSYQIALWGVFPNGVPVRAIGNGVNLTGTVPPAGDPVTLNIPANTTGDDRSIAFQYNWNGQWVDIETKTQMYQLKVGDQYGGGIVYWVNSSNPYDVRIVAPEESDLLKWAEGREYPTSYSTNQNAMNGKEISDQVRRSSVYKLHGETGDFAVDYPAFNYCYNLTTGGVPKGTWFVPSKKEHSELAFGQLNYVNQRLEAMGGKRVGGTLLWLSTGAINNSADDPANYAWLAWPQAYAPAATWTNNNVRCVRKR